MLEEIVVRALFVALVVAGTAAGHLAFPPPEPPIRDSLDDLRADAVALLEEADGVAKVERLVAVDRPKHRIIHIRDWHWVPYDLFAADLRDVEPGITDDEIKTAYRLETAVMRLVQESQKKLLRCLVEHHGVKRIWVEGLTDADMPIHHLVVRALGGLADVPSQLGIEVMAAEDAAAFEAAGREALGLVFDGPANAARERAIIGRVMTDEVAVVILGGDHDLSAAVPRGVELLSVTVAGYPTEE